MRNYDRNQVLISLHVPKCGGTSLRTVLAGWYQKRFYHHEYSDKLNQLPPRRDFRGSFRQRLLGRSPGRGACVHGHFDSRRGTGVPQYYPYASQFITILRDPFEIAVSDYFYAKAKGENRFVEGKRTPLAKQYRSFDQFFELYALRSQAYVIRYMPIQITLDNFARLFDTQFVYIGVAEDMPASVNRLADRLGFPRVAVPHVNQSPRDEAITPGLREAFVKEHPVEYAMYEYALAHYKD